MNKTHRGHLHLPTRHKGHLMSAVPRNALNIITPALSLIVIVLSVVSIFTDEPRWLIAALIPFALMVIATVTVLRDRDGY